MMSPTGRAGEEIGSFSRELESVKDKTERMDAVLVDVQVRLATLESKRTVSQDEFEPIRRLVWGAVGTILTITLIAMLALVLNKTGVGVIKP